MGHDAPAVISVSGLGVDADRYNQTIGNRERYTIIHLIRRRECAVPLSDVAGLVESTHGRKRLLGDLPISLCLLGSYERVPSKECLRERGYMCGMPKWIHSAVVAGPNTMLWTHWLSWNLRSSYGPIRSFKHWSLCLSASMGQIIATAIHQPRRM